MPASYAAGGIALPRTTFEWEQAGPAVWITNGNDHLPMSMLKPGDLLYSAGLDGTSLNPVTSRCASVTARRSKPHAGDVVKVISVPGDVSIVTRPLLTRAGGALGGAA